MKKLSFLFALLCITMLSWAAPVTYTGAGFSGAINGYSYDIDYSITYDDDHHLTFNATLTGTFKETAGFVFEVWSSDLSTGNFKSLAHGEGNAWSVTDTKDYSSMSGQALDQLRLRLASQVGGTDQLYMSDYTVGLSGAAAIEGPASRATTPTASADKTRAITSWYYGKSCNFIDWGGGTSSQNTRFGKKMICNRAEGNGWLGLVDFGDLDCSGMDKLHMDIWVENNATLRATPIHYGYGEEYRHSISLTGGQWNSIELNLNATDFVSDGSQGAPNDYWNVINQFKFDLLANGLEFWLDNLYFYSNQQPVFTSIAISGNEICKVGENMSLTIETLDQFGQHIDAEYSVTVTPASVGAVVGTTYTASTKGSATITVTSGAISNTLSVFNYQGSNLALNHLVTQSTEFAGYGAARAVDGVDNTEWQGSPTNGTAADKAARTYDCWFSVDLGGGEDRKYDVDLVTIKFEGACSDAYKLLASPDNSAWTEIYSWEYPNPQDGNRTEAHTDLITSSDIVSAGNIRYIKFLSTRAASQWGVKIFEFQVFGSESASPTKSVSAAPNNPAWGTATVKQGGVDKTEVATGSSVTFSAVANTGYTFVNWSNGETRATFDATVNTAMNLTANFRELGTIYCNTLVHSSNGGQEHDAYVTMKRTAENTYQLIVRAEYALGNFSNTEFRIKEVNAENTSNFNLVNKGVLTNDNHTLTGTITSTIEPEMISGKLYVNIVGKYEGQFDRLTNIEYSQPCADPEVTSVTLNKTEATLDLGNTLTLIPSFTPAYLSPEITWQTSDGAKATVSNGVVTPVAPGNVTITARVSESVSATCAITVQAAASHNWYGYGTDKGLDYTYRIEYTTDHHIVAHVKRQGDKVGLVDPFMNINNNIKDINVTEGEDVGWKKGTTDQTYNVDDEITIIIQSNFAGASSSINIPYTVGADNMMPTIVPSTLTLSEESVTLAVGDQDLQLTSEIHHCDAANKTLTWTSDDESVATVVNGLIHPVGVGTTTIHATTHNNIPASCNVTIVGALTPQTSWGNGTSDGVAIAYSITRNADHTLTYAIEALHDKNDFWVQVNDGEYHTAPLNEGLYTWTSTATYTDGAVINGFIYAPFAGGAAHIDFSYTVGATTAEVYVPIVLDDAAEDASWIAANDNKVREATVTRSFTQPSEWYTLCLPFDMSHAQLEAAFGAGYTLAEMTGAEDRGSLIHLNFDYVHALVAGKAYMFKPGVATTTPTFEGVTIKNVDPATLKSENSIMHFQGTFNKITLNSEYQRFVGPENYLYEPLSEAEGGTPMKAFRCFFTIPEGSPARAAAKRARVVVGSQVVTEFDAVQGAEQQATKVVENGVLYIIRDGHKYNAQGMLVK